MGRKLKVGMLILFGSILLCVSGARASENDIIANDASGIPDPKLYQEIAKTARGYGEKAFTKREAERVRKLCIFDGGLKDLTGIGYLCNLEELYIEDKWDIGAHTFTSLKPLQDLKELRELVIDRNWNLKSLAGIEGLTQLRRLSVTRTRLNSLPETGALQGLRVLNLRQHSLKSLAGIEGLTQLEELRADYGELSGIREIASLKQLKSLSLRDNRLTDVKELCHLKQLTELYIDGNRLTDIGAVKGLKNLNVISATDNRLVRLPKLKWGPYETLDFRGNRLSERELNARLKKLYLDNIRFNVAGSGARKAIESRLTEQIMFQDSYRIRLTSPRDFQKISKGTRRIAGRIQRSGPYRGEIYVSVNDERARSQNSSVRVDAGGRIIPAKGKRSGSVNNALVRVQPDGSFAIDRAMVDKKKGDGVSIDALPRQWKKARELFFEVYLYSEESKCLKCVKSVLITEKADYDIGYDWGDF